MFNCYEEKKVTPNLTFGVNLLRNDQRAYSLPGLHHFSKSWIEDGSIIELIMLDEGNFSIESFAYPIRFGKYFGNKVFFNPMHDQFNINPKFVFDAENKQWVLMNVGYVCFAEYELDYKSNNKLFGREEV